MRGVLLLVLWFGLGCAGLSFTKHDFVDATEAEVEAAGFRVPDGALGVHLKDRMGIDVRSTWLRYRLPPDGFEALRDEVRAAPGAQRASDATPPHTWPDFGIFDDFDPPEWWSPPPGAEVLRFEYPASYEPGGDNNGRGRLWTFDETRHEVHHWMWQWEWWTG